MLLLAVAALVASACGGKTSDQSADAAHPSSTRESGNSSGSASGTDASSVDAIAPTTCTPGASPGGDPFEGETVLTETCSDGSEYVADCRCPAGVCICTKNGVSGGTVAYACETGASGQWAACGFPQ